MLLLRTIAIAGSSSNNILYFKLVRLGVYMVKLCHEKMLILKCILPPPRKKKLNLFQKIKLTSYPLENLEHPDKKLNSLGIILIPWKTFSLWKNISIPPQKKFQSTRKTSLSTTQKSLNHHEKASTPILEKFSISPKTLNPSEKFSTPLKYPQELPPWENLNSTSPETI